MNSARSLTFKVLSEYKDNHVFKGIDLANEVCKREGKIHYPDTILRYMRDYRKQNDDFDVVLIDKRKSMYQKIGVNV